MLTSVSYSLKSADSESLGGRPASAYALAESVNTTAITASLNNEVSRAQLVEGNLALDIAAETIARENGFVALRTSTQTAVLRTDQSNSYVNSTPGGTSVHAKIETFASHASESFHAETDSPAGVGLVGIASARSGDATGVRGISNGEEGGSGVWGTTQAQSANSAGVYGESNGAGVGGWFEAWATTGPGTALLCPLVLFRDDSRSVC